jgi:hypothetical protein
MHEYSVQLLIVGDDLDEAEVSKKLGLQPTVFLKKGEPMGSQKRRTHSSWAYDVRPSTDEPAWSSLEDGLKALADQLMPLKNTLSEIRQRYSTDAYCGHFGSGFGGGPSISAETLGRLADLGLMLTIKTYWGDNERVVGPQDVQGSSPDPA